MSMRPSLPCPALTERVAQRLSLTSTAEAEPIVDAVFTALATQIREPERAQLAERLPAPLATAVRHGRPTPTLGVDELFGQLAERLEVSESRASSFVEATCEALLCSLMPSDRERLAMQLSAPWAEQLERLSSRCCGPAYTPVDRPASLTSRRSRRTAPQQQQPTTAAQPAALRTPLRGR